MLNKKARYLIGYDKLVEALADKISFPEEEKFEVKDLERWLGAGYEKWEFKDWYRLKVDIRRKKRCEQHKEITAEVIFNSLPWAAQQAAQEAVNLLLKKAVAKDLFRLNEEADIAVNILWNMFHCMGIDIKNTVEFIYLKKKNYSWNDMNENRLLLDFITALRDMQWYGQGEVASLRTKKA